MTTTEHSNAGTVVIGVAVAAVIASVANVVVSLIARALGVPADFAGLTPMVFIPFTIVGTAVGAVGWRLVRDRSAEPRRLMRKLVPIVVVASFVPDVALLAIGVPLAGTITLMVMHMIVAATAVPVYLRVLPLSR